MLCLKSNIPFYYFDLPRDSIFDIEQKVKDISLYAEKSPERSVLNDKTSRPSDKDFTVVCPKF
jgi:hypothetical protein